MSRSNYFYSGSPFLPVFDEDSIIEEAMGKIKEDVHPTMAICFALDEMMLFHIKQNLFRREIELRQNFGTTLSDLALLRMGYEYSFDTIVISYVYYATKSLDIAFSYFPKDPPLFMLPYIKNIRDNILITRDLIRQNITGFLIMEYLEERPFVHDIYFDTGQEIAKSMYFHIGTTIASRLS